MQRWMIDGIEEETARVEVDGGKVTHLPAWLLPGDAADGDVLRVTHDRRADRCTVTVSLDPAATRAAREASARQVRNKSGGGDPGGNIHL